jgi:hypothetical protein
MIIFSALIFDETKIDFVAKHQIDYDLKKKKRKNALNI